MKKLKKKFEKDLVNSKKCLIFANVNNKTIESMERIYLVCYVDEVDNTKDVICASREENLSQESREYVTKWLNAMPQMDEETIDYTLGELEKGESAYLDDYTIFVEETYLY